MESALHIGEITRKAAISHADRANGGRVPAVLSGHGLSAGNCHEHAFYLPEDSDDDGYIDHLLIHAPAGLSPAVIHALDSITRLWQREGLEWQVLMKDYGKPADLNESCYLGTSRVWTSVTPYLHPWFAKKHFGIAEQIARECRQRNLPEPARIEPVERLTVGGTPRRPVHFRRFRSTPKRLRQPDTRGQFVRLTFPEPITGPIALGFACHFGLGLFRPEAGEPED
ncbi:type I-G CRISPR-associated protein Csb2 [Arhodomonas sp. AD133]|uniref:type I-G CRISPR-associated protein Csb2 n=1 Tax=Arhodomonas sp. AD133 TaxID=3415009 RepID=UPI003EB7613B